MNRVLIVDDDTINRELMATLLSDEGYFVSTAVNGQQAIRRLRQINPTIMLLDLLMPVMDGHEVLREMRANRFEPWAKIPVIILTAVTDDPELKLMPPVVDSLTKPFTSEKLNEALRKAGAVPPSQPKE